MIIWQCVVWIAFYDAHPDPTFNNDADPDPYPDPDLHKNNFGQYIEIFQKKVKKYICLELMPIRIGYNVFLFSVF